MAKRKLRQMIMKFLIIANTIIPFIACIQVGRALVIAYHTQVHFKRSIRYEIAEDKTLYERAVRLYMYTVMFSNIIWFMWNLSRIANDWLPFSNHFIAATSILFSIALFLKGQLLLMIHKGHSFTWLKKWKI